VDPWGSVVAQCSDIPRKHGEGDFCIAEIDTDRLASVRQGISLLNKVNIDMPLWEQRRNDVYPVI
jgi:deaminated glutathione amidase